MPPSNGNPLLDYFIANGGPSIHKWIDYFEIYHRSFSRYRSLPITFVEVGVQNGGSARMWRDYFGPNARIIGIDIDPNCMALQEDGFEIWIGDQADPDFWQEFVQAVPSLDIVLDDGGHTMRQQIVTLQTLFPLLNNGGTYLCEDTHTSYFPKFGGGRGRPETFLEHVKSLIDDIHAFHHLPLSDIENSYMANNLHSISVFDSIVVLERRTKNPPVVLARGREGHISNPPAMTHIDVRRACGYPDK